MKIIRTKLPEVLVLEPRVLEDNRGFFLESYSQESFDQAVGAPVRFVQDNHSRSRRGVLRGLHYQVPPRAQGKLVRVTSGRILDVAVDIRRSSPRFGRWVSVELSAANHLELWVPSGFAHGFLVLSESADVLYKVTDYYSPENEGSIRWDDPSLGVHWPLGRDAIHVSERDGSAPCLSGARVVE